MRKIGILLDLVRNRCISLGACERTYGTSKRTILRDLQELRAIGETAGFHISERKHRDTFELSEFKARPAGLARKERRLLALVAELSKAFGEPVHDIAEQLNDEVTGAESFLRVVQPQLADGSSVAEIFRALDDAWRANARVAFRYRGTPRTVEPAAAIVRSGRYYLVARDVAKGRDGWRTFAMDLIAGPIRRAGTYVPKPAPAKYLSTNAIGFFKGDGSGQTVEVTFSPSIAAAAMSRKWQDEQVVRPNADGTVTIAMCVDDVDEVVRWSLGYGDEAWISAPPPAVVRARAMVARIGGRYA